MANEIDPRIGKDGRTYAEVIATRDKLHDDEQAIGTSFDTHLLALSSGALAVSIGFVEKIATDPHWTVLLFASWASFATCILINLLAILVSQESINRHAALTKMSYELEPGTYDDSNRYERWVGRLNWTALVFFILAVILIVAFSVANQKGSLMASQSSTFHVVEKSAGSLVHITPASPAQTSATGHYLAVSAVLSASSKFNHVHKHQFQHPVDNS